MIDNKQREKLKEHLSSHYTKDVLKVLKKKGVTAKNGEPFSQDAIRMVMYGNWEHQDIEDAIFTVYKRRKAKAKRIEANRHKILAD